MIWDSAINMKYLKLFENYNEDAIYMIDSEYQSLKSMLKSVLDIIGFGIDVSALSFTNHKLMRDKLGISVQRILVKLDFRSVEYSILWFICKAYLNEEQAREGYRVMALSTKFLDPAAEVTAFIHIQNTPNEYSMDADKAFKILIDKILNYFINVVSDTRICIGNSSEYQYPIFKKVILNYFRYTKHEEEIDTELYNGIKEYIGNLPNSHTIFNDMRNKNSFLFSKFQDSETLNSADLGDMGYND